MKNLNSLLCLAAGLLALYGCSQEEDGGAYNEAASSAQAQSVEQAAFAAPSATNLNLASLAQDADIEVSTKLLRYPDIHDNMVAFVYGSDIWVASVDGGVAHRVTSHPGLELFPKFSPDGEWIAFTGQYDGDEQVYIVPTVGGTPKRLTAYPARGPMAARWGYDNQVMGWSPDGRGVLFRSHRDHFNITDSALYIAPVDGGLAERLPMTTAGAGDYAPDGGSLLYSPRSRDFRTWKRYRGGWAQDLWVYDINANNAHKVAASDFTERDPMWTDNGVYFVSDRDGYLNIYALGEDGESAEQRTFHTTDVRWASADADGDIVFELNGELRILAQGADEDRAIPIYVGDDGKWTRPRAVDFSNYIRGYSLSPNGERVAFSARGDILSAPVGEGVVRNLTRSSDAHDRAGVWSPDGETIAFISDRSGEEEVWLVDARGEGSARQLTTGNQTRFYRLVWAPDGSQLALGDMYGQLFAVDAANGAMTKIGDMGAWYNQDFSWSASSRYLAFAALGENFFRTITVWDSNTNRSHAVTDSRFNSFSPSWDPKGRYLYYLSDREFAPQIGSIEWNYVVDRETQVYVLALQEDADNPFAPKNPEGAPKDDEADGEADDASDALAIDFEGIEARVIRAPIVADNYDALVAGAEHLALLRRAPFYYGRDADIASSVYAFSIADTSLTLLAGASGGDLSTDVSASVWGFHYVADAGQVLMRASNGFSLVPIDGGVDDARSISTDGLTAAIAPTEEWTVIFDEVWRRFRDFFYVENLHGYDWDEIRQAYQPLLAHVSHRSDLNYVIGEMIGELNAGHAYVFGGDQGLPDRPDPALLGARYVFDEATGAYRISDILAGDNAEDRYRSPLTEVGVNVNAGDYVLEVNGVSLSKTVTPYEVLKNAGGGLVELVVSNSPNRNGARRVVVNPIGYEGDLLYHEWVERNRERVEVASDGRLGYVHIPDMNVDGVREFIKGYYGQIRKDGLVVDVRGNGGGNVSQMILERLLRAHFSNGYVTGEKYPRVYPWGVGGRKVFTGEIAVIANERTLSDGDAFTWTFQQSGKGPVIGKRTWGGTVGIDNTGALLDGGGVRVPQFALAGSDGSWVVEGEGVTPDIDVENDPVSEMAGEDRQLDEAVETLLATLGDSRPGKLAPPAAAPVKTP